MATVQISVADTAVDVTICEEDIVVLSSEIGIQGPRGTQVLSGTVDPSPTIGLIGDQYINTATGFLFGPKTEEGWGEGVLLGFGLTISDVAAVHLQTTPSNVWEISNPLQFIPNIVVVDLSGNVIEGDYVYGDGIITATFSQSITGTAYLS